MKNNKKFLSLAGAALAANLILVNPVLANEINAEYRSENQDISNVEKNIAEIKDVKYFETIQKGTSDKVVVFIGGVNDTYHFWDKHIDLLKGKNVTVLGFEGSGGKGTQPHNVEFMDNNAQYIANALEQLGKSGYSKIEVVAHSLGGVVSKKSMHILEDENRIADNVKIKFTAVNSPFGGYSAADSALYMPFLKPVYKLLNVAMAGDMSPKSDFYKSISKPFSGKIEASMVESLEDNIAQPSSDSSKERYKKVTDTFHNHQLVGGNHEFAYEPENLKSFNVVLVNSDKSLVSENIMQIRAKALSRENEQKNGMGI